jgi:hypothetical protein
MNRTCFLALGTFFALLEGCGGSEFTAAHGATGGNGGDGSGGDAGEVGTGGLVGSGGGSGECDCDPGQYCPAGSTECRACTEFATIGWGNPEKLETISLHPSGVRGMRFPRPVGDGNALFYRVGSEDASASILPQLWYTPDYEIQAGNSANAGFTYASGPLLNDAISQLGNVNFVFDAAGSVTDQRDIWIAYWDGAGISNATDIAPPFNSTVGTLLTSDYSVAVARDTKRAYWMSDRFSAGAPLLVTGLLGAEAVSVVDIYMKSGTCPRTGRDATPWMMADGRLMLFRAFPYDAQCQPIDGDATDLFAVPIDAETGLQGSASPISLTGVNEMGSSETDPALSPDACFLYYASDSDSDDFTFDIYRASRL